MPWDPNRQPIPGTPSAIVRWWDQSRGLMENYSNVHDVHTLYTQVNSAFESPQQRLEALIFAREAIDFNEAANARLSQEISELAKFTHQHPDG